MWKHFIFVIGSLSLLLVPHSAQSTQGNSLWAITLTPGTDPATFAGTNAFVLVRPVPYLADTYLFTGTTDQRYTRILANDPQVYSYQRQIPRPRFTRTNPLTDLGTVNQWHWATANLPPAWDAGYSGDGVLVGVVDDGIDAAHPELAPNYAVDASYDYNFGDPDPTHDQLEDRHGTAVAGVIAAAYDNSPTSCGVGAAYDADVAALRLLSQPITDADEADALSHNLAAAAGSLDISNNSWGPSDTGFTLEGPGPLAQAALTYGTSNGRNGLGIIYVWAGGNGYDLDHAGADGYAGSRYTISVAATTHTGKRAAYSEAGSAHLVNAPSNGDGASITTTDRLGGVGFSTGDCHRAFGGTSAAAPLVSGVIALMLEANPSLTWRDVQHILVETATQNDPSHSAWRTNAANHTFNPYYGFGTIDAGAAVALAETWQSVPAEHTHQTSPQPVALPIPDNAPSNPAQHALSINTIFDQLEHVEVVFNATHTRRGDIAVYLQSPAGTISQLMAPRRNDCGLDPVSNTCAGLGFVDWTFTSVAFWGENPQGTWTLYVTDNRQDHTGTVEDWSLNLYGTAIDAPIATPFTAPAITAQPRFTWAYTTRADWYRLQIHTADNTPVFDRWYASDDPALVCAAGVCHVQPDAPLTATADTTLYWRIDQYLYGQPYTPLNMTALPITFAAPQWVQPDTPSLDLPLGNPQLTWTVPTADTPPDWYHIQMRHTSNPAANISLWVEVGNDITCEPTCSLSPADFGIASTVQYAGTYVMTVRGYHANYGYTLPARQNVIITATAPPPPTDVTITNNIASWTANSGVYFQVRISNGDVIHWQSWIDRHTACGSIQSTACSVQLPQDIQLMPGETYTTHIRTDAPGATGAWSTGTAFIYTAPMIDPPQGLQAVSSAGDMAFHWDNNPVATYYQLRVHQGETVRLQQWYRADEIPCVDGLCTLIPDIYLNNGDYTWSVRAYTPEGRSAWSDRTITINHGVPTLSDEGREVLRETTFSDADTQDTVTFQWLAGTDAAWYRLRLWDATGTSTHHQWYRGHIICESITCTVTLNDTYLRNGTYQWTLQAWGAGGMSAQSTPQTFTFAMSTPSAPILVSPAANVLLGEARPTFTWEPVTGGTWYQVAILDAADNPITAQWVHQPTCEETCQYTFEQDLRNGLLRWQVRAWGPGGMGQWSPRRNVSLYVAAPASPILIAPQNNTITQSATVTFTWEPAAQVTWYRLRILDDDRTAIYDEWLPREAVCTLDCQVSQSLKPGEYTWQVAAYTIGGVGPWSAGYRLVILP